MQIRRFGSPNDKQKLFLKSETRFTAYGGARGGGKSWAVRCKAALLGINQKYAGIRMLLLRRTYPELRENHIRPLAQLLNGIARFKESEKVFLFPNGSVLKFGYCDSESDVLQYQGQEFDIIFIDEATQFTEYQFSTLTACLRGANSFPKRIYLTCNPGGVGHEWVKRLFIDRQYKNSEKAPDYTFIPAGVYDNHILMDSDPGYVQMLENLPDSLRRAWLDGDWNVFAGQYFREFSTSLHVAEPFDIPVNWNRYLTLDYGLDMLAAYWIAVDTEKNAYVYRELYEGKDLGEGHDGLTISQALEEIKRLTGKEALCAALAPPDLWNRRQETGKSVADWFAQGGLPLTKTSNERIAGWMAVKEWLKPVTDDSGNKSAKLKIFRNCANLIRTLPLLQFDEKKPNDAASQPHEITHAPDALRGFCVYWTSAAKRPPEQKVRWTRDMMEDYRRAGAAQKAYLIEKWGNPF